MRKGWWIGAIVLLWIVWSGSDDPLDQDRTSSQPVNETTQRSPSPTTDTSTYVFVTGNRVRIRSGPSTSDSILGHLDRGARVRLQGTDGSWAEVVSSFGRGWVFSDYLSLEQPAVSNTPASPPTRQVAAPTDTEIREARAAIIRQSIASYPGSCPCPYNVDRAGRRCGGRSAWSRPGGYSPICYESDVSEDRLQSYFARQR